VNSVSLIGRVGEASVQVSERNTAKNLGSGTIDVSYTLQTQRFVSPSISAPSVDLICAVIQI
jgi:hypothetical protein